MSDTKRTSILAVFSLSILLTGCGGGGGGGTIEGTYYPQFGPNANRLDMALTDQSWAFSADGSVVTNSAAGARPWTYKVSGKKVRLQGAGDRNSGESRVLHLRDDGCILDGPANRAESIAFCA